MESGSAVPTLSPGFSETAAEKVLTVASGRLGTSVEICLAEAGAGWVAPTESMFLLNARFFAEDRAGRRRPAKTAMMSMATRSPPNFTPPYSRFTELLHIFPPHPL